MSNNSVQNGLHRLNYRWDNVQRRTIYTGSIDSTPASRSSGLLLTLINLGENENTQKKYKEFEETVHEPPVEVGIGATA